MSPQESISQEAIGSAVSAAKKLIAEAQTTQDLKKVRSSVIGEGSALAAFSSQLGKLDASAKAEAGERDSSEP